MTDAPLSPDDDEIVSAYLDGEATVEERALVEADPRLRARADELRRNATSIRDEPGPAAPTGGLDAMLTAAMAAAAEVLPVDTDARSTSSHEAPSARTEATADSVAPSKLADVIKLERKRPPKTLAILSAAAAVVVVLGVLGGVLRASRTSTSSDSATMAAAPLSTSSTIVPSAARAGESPTSGGGNKTATPDLPTGAPLSTTTAMSPNSTTIPLPPPTVSAPTVGGSDELVSTYRGHNLGPLLSGADVRAAVANRRSATAPTTTPPTTRPGDSGAPNSNGNETDIAEVAARLTACDRTVRGTDRELGDAVYSATGTFAGTPALVILYAISADVGNANGVNRLYTVHRDTCAVLNTQTY